MITGDETRDFSKKLYEIAKNVSAEQLNSIINDNIKTENEFQLNVPSTSSSLAAFPSSFKDEPKLPGEGDESEDDTDNETTGGASESDILPEDPNLLIQNNNSGGARPHEVTRRAFTIDEMGC
jgi:hypothetical protein